MKLRSITQVEVTVQKERPTDNTGKGDIGPVEAYNILLQRQMNEDRIVIERTAIFLAASSFLFLAFAMLLNPNLTPIFKVLRIALPILGMCLTFLLYHLNLSATNALRFWHRAEQQIEEKTKLQEFAYMYENKITPHLHGYEAIRGEKEWKKIAESNWVFESLKGPWRLMNKPLQWGWLRPIYQLYLPAIFFVLWVVSLVVAIIN